MARPFCHPLAAALLAACAAAVAVEEPFLSPGHRPSGVTVEPDGSVPFTVASEPGRGWNMWWMFTLEGLTPGQSLLLKPRGNKARFPVVTENGRDWRYFGIGKPVAIEGSRATFAWYVPYLLADAEAFAARAPELRNRLRVRELCRSEQDRPVPLFEIGVPLSEGKPAIWLQAREHAWEVGGSWTAQGLMDWAVGDSPEAVRLRATTTILVAPLMDVDNVERGNGGKAQKPHDHNQDWTDQPFWASVRAAQAELRALISRGQLVLCFDLHCPGWGGPFEWWTASLDGLTPEIRKRTEWLAETLREESASSIPFAGFKIMPDRVYRSSRVWVGQQTARSVVGGLFEIPVAPPAGFSDHPPAHHLQLGAALGRTFDRYLMERGRP